MLLRKLDPHAHGFIFCKFQRFLNPQQLKFFLFRYYFIAPDSLQQSAVNNLDCITEFLWMVLMLSLEPTNPKGLLLFLETARHTRCESLDAILALWVDQVRHGRLDPFHKLF